MARRKIIKINEELCDGCGLCAQACAEGAIQIIDGKARLISETYCDGLGACIGECPRGAISLEEREAADFDQQAVSYHLLLSGKTMQNHHVGNEKSGENAKNAGKNAGDRPAGSAGDRPLGSISHHGNACGCPGAAIRSFAPGNGARVSAEPAGKPAREHSALTHWPVQLKLVPSTAPFLKNADILVCADCVPFAVPDFHRRFLEGKVVLVGCPKLDDLDYYLEKLTEILTVASPRSLTVLRMEVPCCGGIGRAAIEARNRARPQLPIEVHTISIRGGATAHGVAEAPASCARGIG